MSGSLRRTEARRPIWADEFDKEGRPRGSKWGYDLGDGSQHGLAPGWGNGELQWYTESRSENARMEGGLLIIEARRDSHGGHEYTSARLKTKDKFDFRYGRVEVRARLPSGQGVWPAIWLLPSKQIYGTTYWPDNGEIDIAEWFSACPHEVRASVHTHERNHRNRTQVTAVCPGNDWSSAFHTFAVEWREERIEFFVDEKKFLSYLKSSGDWRRWPFDREFYILLNVAVGGLGGDPDPDSFPHRMEVDYVRVYRLDP